MLRNGLEVKIKILKSNSLLENINALYFEPDLFVQNCD